MASKGPLSREEILGGLAVPGKQASALVFAIESRTAYLADQSRQAMAQYLTEDAAESRSQAFLQAIAKGGNLPLQPTIQDLERFAPRWADLVPTNPRLRAAAAHQLGRKYPLVYSTLSGVRAALGLDQPAVRAAHERLYGEPLTAIFTTRLRPRDRLRWAWAGLAARLESLPPFWTAFALVLTQTIGGGMLAMPIALAGIGPLAGLGVVLVMGVVNILTITAMAEAMARSGQVRYGRAYFGRIVSDYFGGPGSLLLTPALLIWPVVALLMYYIGFSLTLADATGLAAPVWAALLLLVGLFFLSRKSIGSTVASALIVGAVNIVLVLTLSGLALTRMEGVNLSYVNLPLPGGDGFKVSILQSIFGVVLLAYFGHTSIGSCARVVLLREPSGRGLIRGCIAGTAAAMVLYGLWVVSVTGAIGADELAAEKGTALAPLAEKVGPSIHVFGSVFALLSMGLASVHSSLSLFYLVQERLDPAVLGRRLLGGEHERLWLDMTPVILIAGVATALLATGQESFTRPAGFGGTVAITLVGGILPVLLLVASRRKGEFVPGLVFRLLGHPLVIAGLYGLFVTSLLLHGLVIWQNPLERAVALAVVLLLVGATVAMVRRGAFRRRLVVEVRAEQRRDGQAAFAVTAGGEPTRATVQLTYGHDQRQLETAAGTIPRFATLVGLDVQVPTTTARDVKVWTHQVTPEGDSTPLPARLTVDTGGQQEETYDMSRDGDGGQIVLPLQNGTRRLALAFGAYERDPLRSIARGLATAPAPIAGRTPSDGQAST